MTSTNPRPWSPVSASSLAVPSVILVRRDHDLIQPLHEIPLRLVPFAHGIESRREFTFLFRASHQIADPGDEISDFSFWRFGSRFFQHIKL